MKNIVYNDLNESNYCFKYDDFKFYFSSNFYLEKFEREYVNFIKDETMKLKIKFKCNIFADYLILLLLYQRIEKRGFRVENKNNEIIENPFFNINLDKLSIKG